MARNLFLSLLVVCFVLASVEARSRLTLEPVPAPLTKPVIMGHNTNPDAQAVAEKISEILAKEPLSANVKESLGEEEEAVEDGEDEDAAAEEGAVAQDPAAALAVTEADLKAQIKAENEIAKIAKFKEQGQAADSAQAQEVEAEAEAEGQGTGHQAGQAQQAKQQQQAAQQQQEEAAEEGADEVAQGEESAMEPAEDAAKEGDKEANAEAAVQEDESKKGELKVMLKEVETKIATLKTKLTELEKSKEELSHAIGGEAVKEDLDKEKAEVAAEKKVEDEAEATNEDAGDEF